MNAHTATVCKHCGVAIKHHQANLWHSNGFILPQYCFVDPMHGSRLHEPLVETPHREEPTMEHIFVISDAIQRAFSELPKEKEAFLISASTCTELKVPNKKFDKQGWKDFLDVLKYRHNLEAFMTPKDGMLVCAYRWLSGTPRLTDEEIDQALKAHEVAGEVAQTQYEALIARLKF